MKTAYLAKDGNNMYTKIVRKVLRKLEEMMGHCGGGGGAGHCS